MKREKRNRKRGEGRGEKRRDTKRCNDETYKHCYKSAAVERNPSYAFIVSLRHSPTVNFTKTDRKLRQYFREILTRL